MVPCSPYSGEACCSHSVKGIWSFAGYLCSFRIFFLTGFKVTVDTMASAAPPGSTTVIAIWTGSRENAIGYLNLIISRTLSYVSCFIIVFVLIVGNLISAVAPATTQQILTALKSDKNINGNRKPFTSSTVSCSGLSVSPPAIPAAQSSVPVTPVPQEEDVSYIVK